MIHKCTFDFAPNARLHLIRHDRSLIARLLLIGSTLALVSAPAQAQVNFTGLGVFDGVRSGALDVSGDGSVVVGLYFTADDKSHVFRWTAGGSILRSEGGTESELAISPDGSFIVGRFGAPNGSQAYRWPLDGEFEGLGDLPGGAFQSGATDVSDQGSVVVGVGTYASSPTSSDREAFRWTQETGMVGLGDLPGGETSSAASGVSADGSVVVGVGNTTRTEAFRWTAETGLVSLGLLPNKAGSSAFAVSADGRTVVGISWSGIPPLNITQEAFRWTQETGMVGIGDLPGSRTLSTAYDVSGDGSVIVGEGERLREDGQSSVNRAFFWTADTGMVELQQFLLSSGVNLDGWTLDTARGISEDGRTVVGFGLHNGRIEAYVATIPEPSTIVLAIVATAGLLLFALRIARRNGGVAES
jgi:probable HAF family extracellular repeat protein